MCNKIRNGNEIESILFVLYSRKALIRSLSRKSALSQDQTIYSNLFTFNEPKLTLPSWLVQRNGERKHGTCHKKEIIYSFLSIALQMVVISRHHVEIEC